MAAPRYLIGGGEQLAEEVARPGRDMSEKAHPYTFETARSRLASQVRETGNQLRALPPLACPDGIGVISVTLHPAYLAKSYHPGKLFDDLDMHPVGSRAVHIVPETVTGKQSKTLPQPAPQYFVSTSVDGLTAWANAIELWKPAEVPANQFRRVEQVSALNEQRLKPIPEAERIAGQDLPLEVVLHGQPTDHNGFILHGFEEYVRSLGLDVDLQRRRHVGGLCFLPMRAPYERLDDIVKFSFLRALRRMPRLVPLDPFVRGQFPGFRVTLPESGVMAPDLSVAIFDGGLPDNHGLDPWVTLYEPAGVGNPIPGYQRHGLAVTSAFLFGPIVPGHALPCPLAKVDHWRVLGTKVAQDDFELYSVLSQIENAVESRHYDFINISLGPDSAMEDDDVNAWTSTLDSLLAHGETVATVACGNNGEGDHDLKLNRVQPPSDGVNMIGVGASDRQGAAWMRASYSAIGPGRSPGYVKPDILAFGGSHANPFLVLDDFNPETASGDMGTSFSSPLTMRAGVGIRTQFEETLWAPTIKALLVQHANPAEHGREEVGWGRLSHDVDDLVLCNDGEAHIIFQRQMPLTGAVRLYLPVPKGLKGDINLKATFCFYSEIDPEDSLNYTRAGLEVTFRPDTLKLGKPYLKDGRLITPKTPPSDSFFGPADFYSSEVERRQDAHKWETTRSASRTKRSSSLNQPAFDVTYLAREHGHHGTRNPQVRFGLVLTLRNRNAPDLYERIVTEYRPRLQPLRPRTLVPIRLPPRQ
ncbi:S8 family peptidase [Skermanella pratensis]|uniref:S8 family peptidase n=1 Tax=Skermanella pratensis TaxID=2233999 RepID=UPI001301249F|nr:S8 family peptidase [Skermanella pratensis]